MDTPWTDRPASPAEHFPKPQQRTLELPGTEGPDGAPLVVRIQRAPGLLYLDVTGGPTPTTTQESYAFAAKIAELGLLEPQFDFGNGPTGAPRWDDVPLPAQLAIVEAISSYTNQGLMEVARHASRFRGREPDGTANGVTGAGPDSVGSAVDAAASVAGDTAEP